MKRKEEFDKILFSGEYYDCGDKKLLSYQFKCKRDMDRYNKTNNSRLGLYLRSKLLKKMFGSIGKNGYVEPPIHMNFGGKNVFIGDNFYSNFNLTLVDDGKIIIGNDVKIGPNVTIATPLHPLDSKGRLSDKNQRNLPVVIKDNVWIASNVTIHPGVTIGENSVIASNSVVTKDVPPHSLVMGIPAKVVRELK